MQEKDKKELINKIYELGFEVGNKNHSEIGWVLRDYNKLINDALKNGIKSPENYYEEGKKKGIESRDHGAIGHKSEKETVTASKKIRFAEGIKKDTDKDKVTRKRSFHSPLERPSLSDLPRAAEKIKLSEIPKLLGGFKFLTKK